MFCRSPPKALKTFIKSRSLTQTTGTLRISPSVTQQVQCEGGGPPYYSVVVPRSVGCALAGRDLGSKVAKVDLIFYDGRHFASNKNPQTPRLTLAQEMALLMDRSDRAEVPAVLFCLGDNEGSAITLKGTEGEEMWAYTAQGVKAFSKALRDMK